MNGAPCLCHDVPVSLPHGVDVGWGWLLVGSALMLAALLTPWHLLPVSAPGDALVVLLTIAAAASVLRLLDGLGM